jgi:hypothetical protein
VQTRKKQGAGGRGEYFSSQLPITNYPFPVTYEAVGFGNEANLSK